MKFHPGSSSGCQAADLQSNCEAVGFQGYYGAREQAVGIRQLKIPSYQDSAISLG